MNDVFEQLSRASFKPIDEQIIDMLQRTWAKVSAGVNESAIGRAGVDVTPDVVRTAVYSNINIWVDSCRSRMLDEWMERTPREQNAMLIRAFPDGRTYSV